MEIVFMELLLFLITTVFLMIASFFDLKHGQVDLSLFIMHFLLLITGWGLFSIYVTYTTLPLEMFLLFGGVGLFLYIGGLWGFADALALGLCAFTIPTMAVHFFILFTVYYAVYSVSYILKRGRKTGQLKQCLRKGYFTRRKRTKNLKEGDIPVQAKRWHGISLEEKREIQNNQKYITIKEGIPTIPVFLIALIVTVGISL